MQDQEDGVDGPDSVLGRVRDIRRKWAVQEDEALAYRLQDEEIAQHYSSNRTRNAIVREDAPRAREAQRQEELEALEERLQHLSVLQRQAEEDSKYAKQLATREADAPKVKKQPLSPNGASRDKPSPQELLHHVTNEITENLNRRTKSPPLLGAAKPAIEEPGPSRPYTNHTGEPQRLEEDDYTKEQIRKIQEEKDAAIAKAMQEELDRYDRDKQLALEAQDRELARMIHEKEKARLRRAKEKARLKAEAASAAASSDRGETPDGDSDSRAASRNSCSSERSRTSDVLPPRVPEKLRSPTAEQIGFRAHPKPLPPHPSSQEISSPSVSNHSRLEHHHRLPTPLHTDVPPYMPIHGVGYSPKRNK
ncbi:Coiled-coil domain-containing protein 50 [Orchesella cincta]|uniref:Coiled-coil domain-containing protein 50 n=1 Tax=Orchesella cincta TaxID=48709 RepID=A0A1D2NKS2_ORCCI|nr:Coiled-coil domain-containing protein 50 [Orchesella cincta]